jgi:hypothetical protein
MLVAYATAEGELPQAGSATRLFDTRVVGDRSSARAGDGELTLSRSSQV